jgi:hypothetical protein
LDQTLDLVGMHSALSSQDAPGIRPGPQSFIQEKSVAFGAAGQLEGKGDEVDRV